MAALDVVALTDHDHWGVRFLDEHAEKWETVSCRPIPIGPPERSERMSRTMSDLQHYALCVMQALLGAISPNFRFVGISAPLGRLHVRIVLNREDKEDVEEIEDLEAELDGLLPGSVQFEVSVDISDQPLAWPNEDSIVVFRRRE